MRAEPISVVLVDAEPNDGISRLATFRGAHATADAFSPRSVGMTQPDES